LHFWNTSMLPHTIHPHGLDARQDVDGVPQTSFEIPMMGSFTYDFIAPHAGTYAYHCHVHTVLHLQMGMYGAVVIDSPDEEKTVWENGPAYDIERIWDTGEFDSYWHDNAGGFGMGMWPGDGHGMWSNNSYGSNRHGGGPGDHHGGDHGWWPDDGNDMGPGNGDDWSPDDGNGGWPGDSENSGFPYHDYNPDYFIVNGRSGTDIHSDLRSRVAMDVSQILLLRLVNIGGYLPHRFLFNGLPATAVSSDGRPLPVQEMLEELTVYPGERYDVIVEPGAAGNYQVEIEYLSIYDESVQGTASVPISVRN
jgi:FtsP/CotA-like multicopper oxidase with cupredoxin domain